MRDSRRSGNKVNEFEQSIEKSSNILDELPLTISEDCDPFNIHNSDSSAENEIKALNNKTFNEEINQLETIVSIDKFFESEKNEDGQELKRNEKKFQEENYTQNKNFSTVIIKNFEIYTSEEELQGFIKSYGYETRVFKETSNSDLIFAYFHVSDTEIAGKIVKSLNNSMLNGKNLRVYQRNSVNDCDSKEKKEIESLLEHSETINSFAYILENNEQFVIKITSLEQNSINVLNDSSCPIKITPNDNKNLLAPPKEPNFHSPPPSKLNWSLLGLSFGSIILLILIILKLKR